MRIFFIHHALRKRGNPSTQEDGLEDLGIEDAKLIGKIFAKGLKDKKPVGIFTSPYFRCKETARLINQNLNAPIIEDERLNEFGKWDKQTQSKETWIDLQNRVRSCIKEVVFSSNDDDVALFVTSGVNLVAFTSLVYGLKPSEAAPMMWIPSCSPIGFDITKDSFNIC